MTEEIKDLLGDINIDEDAFLNPETGNVTEGGGERVHFGQYCAISIPVVKAAGTSFTLPGIFDDKFDEATNLSSRQGLYAFKGWRPGKSPKGQVYFNILVRKKFTQVGASYQKVARFVSFEKAWKDEQWPAIAKLDSASMTILVSTGKVLLNLAKQGKGSEEIENNSACWAWARTSNAQSEETFKANDGSTAHKAYWHEWQVFKDKAEYDKASEEYFAQFGGKGASNGSTVDESNFPLTWKGQDGQLLYKMIRDGLAANKTPLAIAQEVSCLQQPGNKPGVRLDGETPLDLPKLFGSATGTPAEMFTF